MRYNQRAHDEYIRLEAWKCSKSPTGAHHWIGDSFVLKCRHCGETKDVLETITPMQMAVRVKKANAANNSKL